MILIAFDCDETIDVNKGPIPVSRLYEINIPPYVQAVIVSESSFCSQLPFPRFVSNDGSLPREVSRLQNLLAAAIAYPSTLNIYVSDNLGDDIIAKNAGYIYVHPKDFHFPIK